MEQKKELLIKEIGLIKPKSITQTVFIYKNVNDLQNLILFIGKPLAMHLNGSIKIKKWNLVDNSVIFRDALGNVTKIIPLEFLKENFDIIETVSFNNKNHSLQLPLPHKK